MSESQVGPGIPEEAVDEHYDQSMTRAQDVAAALRERLPGLSAKKLHKLLYYCQGIHLATFDRPLFADQISAWDMGPVVGRLWYDEKNGPVAGSTATLDEAALNTIGYVVGRYGALTGRDLENLTHAERPWRQADQSREPGGSVRIEREWLREYFRETDPDEVDELDLIGSSALKAWLDEGVTRVGSEPVRDDVDALRRRMRRAG